MQLALIVGVGVAVVAAIAIAVMLRVHLRRGRGEEVYNINPNVYTYGEAQQECLRYGGRLAGEADVSQAQQEGANWCNMGWTDGQVAMYPTQEKEVELKPGECGTRGVNGGVFLPHLRFGANCYGVKPLKEKASNVNAWNTVTGKWSKYDW